MDPFQYLILLVGCVAITLPLEFLLRARVYRRPVRLAAALAPAIVIFVVWDVYGIVAEHWSYNPRFVTGLTLGIVPVEELAFFVVIPICGLLTYEAVGTVLDRLRRRGTERKDGSSHLPASTDGGR